MDVIVSRSAAVNGDGCVSLAALPRGARGAVARIGTGHGELSALDRRLLELGFVPGERVEIVAEALPGRDPFVVRVGHTTLALRRREAREIWIEAVNGGGAGRKARLAANAAQP